MFEFFEKSRILFLLFSLALGPSLPNIAKADKAPESDLPTVNPTTREGRQIAAKIREWFPDAPYMKYVANCESTGLVHRENGQLIRGRVDGLDEGVFQVHMPVHRAEMRKMGLNPDDLDHYFMYVRHLYDKYGLRPWASSKHCWSKPYRLIKQG